MGVCQDDVDPCPQSATLEGGFGNDEIIGLGGFDHVNGGSGKDTCADDDDTEFKSCEELLS